MGCIFSLVRACTDDQETDRRCADAPFFFLKSPPTWIQKNTIHIFVSDETRRRTGSQPTPREIRETMRHTQKKRDRGKEEKKRANHQTALNLLRLFFFRKKYRKEKIQKTYEEGKGQDKRQRIRKEDSPAPRARRRVGGGRSCVAWPGVWRRPSPGTALALRDTSHKPRQSRWRSRDPHRGAGCG